MTPQVERRTELQDPRVDAVGGADQHPDRPNAATTRSTLRTQRARQRERDQDGRPLDPAHPVHDGTASPADVEGLGADDGMGAPIAQGDAGRVGSSREPRTPPEEMTREARDRDDARATTEPNDERR